MNRIEGDNATWEESKITKVGDKQNDSEQEDNSQK